MRKFLEFLYVWVVFSIVPIFVVWTIGLPSQDEWFYFDEVGLGGCIAWGWVSLLIAIGSLVGER